MTSAYSFLSWLRAGIATKIEDPSSDPPTGSRASVPVRLQLTGEPLRRDDPPLCREVRQSIQLYGPGDVIGVDPRAISRTEPRPWITNFEPNYLPHIEFYEEDFLWRYSPANDQGKTGRLTPWLALVVLAGSKDSQPGRQPADGDEFSENTLPDAPLPSITVLDPARTLPPPGELGAWAHVHVNGSLGGAIVSDDTGPALANLAEVLRTNADNACSRLICPRHLKPNTGYHAFLVPAFENGRLAGLGLDPNAKATDLSWGGDAQRPGGGALPYYHRWFFSTGTAGDFEYLVRLLEPCRADVKVARRDIDVHVSPGFNLPCIEEPTGGILKLGGALKTDRPMDKYDTWDKTFPHPFQTALAGLINLADDYLEQQPAAAHAALAVTRDLPQPMDPIITPPLYGRWPALTSRLLTDRDGTSLVPDPEHPNWVHKLNLDPRYRVAANFGTQIVQARQEEFMAAAWAQLGDVLAANAKIRAAQLHREVGFALHNKHLEQSAAGLDATPRYGKALTLTAPVHARVTQRGTGADINAADQFAVGFRVASSRIATASVSPAMRRIIRPGSRLIRTLFPATGTPEELATGTPEELLSRMDLETGGVTAAAPKEVPTSVVTPKKVEDILDPRPPAVAADPSQPPPNPVPGLPTSADFSLRDLNDPAPPPTPVGLDSVEAQNFKKALNALYDGWPAAFAAGRTDDPLVLGVETTARSTLESLRADTTVPRNLQDSVRLPIRLRSLVENFTEALAYPVIDLPMYEALRDLSVEAFVPNLGLVPQNTITLLLTDQAFIEAFMVGLNHELARELLWREYPTDQLGTPFRQFWDPRRALDQSREQLYDIKPIHRWNPANQLGENDNRDSGKQKENLVLVIRGELLKKYPTAAIYAHKARWQLKDGRIDPTQERVPVDLVDPNNPNPVTEIRLPIYEAKVEPDLYLLGFDLGEDEAKGTEKGSDGCGWFFVIKERPGDPRFGADEQQSRVEVWNDLSWPDIDPPATQKGFITLNGAATVPLLEFDNPREDQEKTDQHLEDLSLPTWKGQLSSADIAYILFQAPVLMAVHAQEMLPP